MTKMQRRVQETETRNEQLTAEDKDRNLKWLVVGKRSEKQLIKGTERGSQNNIRRDPQLGD
jgi:hypothetical protein